MQAAFQKFTDNAVSKTINLPAQASVEAVIEGFNLAWKSKCKGITIYRNKSREVQVLNVGQAEPVKEDPGSQLSGQCPNCGGKLMMVEGCATCQNCDYSACSL